MRDGFQGQLLDTVAQLPLREVARHPEGLGYARRYLYYSHWGISIRSLNECGAQDTQVDTSVAGVGVSCGPSMGAVNHERFFGKNFFNMKIRKGSIACPRL